VHGEVFYVTLRAIRALIEGDGAFILARAHPLRFAVERSESTGADLGAALRAGPAL